ncbi:MAG: TRAP transporter permease [Lentisphaeria bacterium]|nr:TRAP transporter permease [Lentisphaeria bacterium]
MATDADQNEIEALKIAVHAEQGPRELAGFSQWLVPLLAVCWSVFQLLLPFVITLNSDVIRTVHLIFAITLVYLTFPACRKRRYTGALSFLSCRRGTPWQDLTLAALAAIAAGYYAFEYKALAERPGMLLTRDLVFGVALLLFLLEAARRSIGPTLACVAATCIALAFCGPLLPSFLAFRQVSMNRLLEHLTLSTGGVYGIPLRVSATMVFLFVLFGALLEKSGGGRYFVELAFSLLGRYRGGPAKAAVLASGLTGMVSGSSIANTVTTGTFTIPLMKRCGYPAEKAAAVEVAASTNGQLMPPVMGAAAFLIAEQCQVPYLAVVRAAFIPAVVSYLTLIFITHLEACKLGLEGAPPEELPRFREVFLKGLHFLLPLALLICLLVLRYSPEYAAFWSILALATLVVARDQVVATRAGASMRTAWRKSGRTLFDSLVAGARNMTGIGVAVATAGVVVGVMSLGPGSLITQVVGTLAGGRLLPMLLITAGVSLVLGMGLPTTANYIVVATMVATPLCLLAESAGMPVNPLAAHLFCFYFGILADDTPPVGLAAYAAAAIAGSDPIKTGIQGFTYDMRTAILPFMFFFNQELLLIGVNSPLHMTWIFLSAMVAMFAFASVTQNYLLVRNRLHESALLGVAALFLLRPRLAPFVETLGVQVPRLVAMALCLIVLAMQVPRARKNNAKTE